MTQSRCNLMRMETLLKIKRMSLFVKLLFLTALPLSFIGCNETKERKELNQIEENVLNRTPNESDRFFKEALSLLKEDKKTETATTIEKGIAALKKERADVQGLYKLNLEKAIDNLKEVSIKLRNGTSISSEMLKEYIADAEINIAH